jgi:hypothetical protein
MIRKTQAVYKFESRLCFKIKYRPCLQDEKCYFYYIYIYIYLWLEGPPLWSSSQEFLAANQEVPGSILGATRFSE